MRQAAALLLLAALIDAANAHGSEPKAAGADANVRTVEIKGPRVHAADVVGAAIAGDVDLGVTPPIGSSRTIERAEIERAFADANVVPPKKIPLRVKITRKSRRLTTADAGQAVRTSLVDTKLARGASLISVSAPGTDVPAEFHHVILDLPSMPRKAGIVTLHVPFTYTDETGAPLVKSSASIKVALPPEAAFADITKGSPIALVVKKGLVEVSVGAVANADADVGSVLPIQLKPSGRVLRAKAIDKNHAVALEDS